MKTITRRRFLQGMASFALCGAGEVARADAGDPAGVSAGVLFDQRDLLIPEDFLGVSFELGAIANDNYLVPDNAPLISLVRGLGAQGVLRVGGNTSDWPASVSQEVTAEKLEHFAHFVVETGWNVIYGLNLGSGTPAAAAEEARLAERSLGSRLLAFQLGNEPDLFNNNGCKHRNYGVNEYLRDWNGFADAIVATVPHAQLAGPDLSYDTGWLGPFAAGVKHPLRFLSHHYYALGPAGNPSVTTTRLLGSSAALVDRSRAAFAEAKPFGLPLRMTEMNSVYNGGQRGVSDTPAAAVWVVDGACTLAAAGWQGINLHGGPEQVYSPFTPDRGGRARPAPIYDGMRFFSAHARGYCHPVLIQEDAPETLRIFAASDREERRLLFVNLSDAAPVTTRVRLLDWSPSQPPLWSRLAPGFAVLERTAEPQKLGLDTADLRGGAVRVELPPMSAVVAHLR